MKISRKKHQKEKRSLLASSICVIVSSVQPRVIHIQLRLLALPQRHVVPSTPCFSAVSMPTYLWIYSFNPIHVRRHGNHAKTKRENFVSLIAFLYW